MSFRSKITPDFITESILLLLRVALIIAAAISLANQNWPSLFASLGTLAVTFVPQVLANQINLRLPLQFELAITIFIYASLFLGEMRNYYERFWWWDALLHTGSGFAFGFVGFLILYLLYERNKVRASPIIVTVFAFCFALAIGAMWEIFEFSTDVLFGTNMQKNGLHDTMWDLIVDAVGAGTASVVGYLYLRFKLWDPFDPLIQWFLKANPRFNRNSKKTKGR